MGLFSTSISKGLPTAQVWLFWEADLLTPGNVSVVHWSKSRKEAEGSSWIVNHFLLHN